MVFYGYKSVSLAVRKRDRCLKIHTSRTLSFFKWTDYTVSPNEYRPIKCAVIIYGYDADGYKGKGQIFADVKTQSDVLK